MSEHTPVQELVQQLVNDHFAQTGIATVDGDTIAELAEEIMGDEYTAQEHALMLTICDGVLRAKPMVQS